MAVDEAKPKAGLEDVVAATSSICYLDGDRGVLAYYGYDIHDLAKGATFEETCYLLWHGRLPNRAELGDLQSQLAAARPVPESILRLMKQLPASDGMDMLRTLTSALGQYDPEVNDSSPQAQYRKAVRLTAQMGSIVATYGRMQAGGGHIQPDPALGHAANFLYMLTGKRPSALETRAFDVSLVLHADHELNASTFAARVAAATLTDLHSAVVGAIGALKGPLHGGANAEVMKMLLEIGEDAPPDRIDDYVRGKLQRKEKIPGFGHRVYTTEDPRATHLRQMSRELGTRAGNLKWFDMSERIEAIVKAEKKLNPNVDFYSAFTSASMRWDMSNHAGVPAFLPRSRDICRRWVARGSSVLYTRWPKPEIFSLRASLPRTNSSMRSPLAVWPRSRSIFITSALAPP